MHDSDAELLVNMERTERMVLMEQMELTELMTKTMVLAEHMKMTKLMTTMMAKKMQIKTTELMTVRPVKMEHTEMMVMPD